MASLGRDGQAMSHVASSRNLQASNPRLQVGARTCPPWPVWAKSSEKDDIDIPSDLD